MQVEKWKRQESKNFFSLSRLAPYGFSLAPWILESLKPFLFGAFHDSQFDEESSFPGQ